MSRERLMAQQRQRMLERRARLRALKQKNKPADKVPAKPPVQIKVEPYKAPKPKPTKPVKAVKPTKPAKPVKPTKPAKPVQKKKPYKPDGSVKAIRRQTSYDKAVSGWTGRTGKEDMEWSQKNEQQLNKPRKARVKKNPDGSVYQGNLPGNPSSKSNKPKKGDTKVLTFNRKKVTMVYNGKKWVVKK